VSDGTVKAGPAEQPIHAYRVEVAGGQVHLTLPERREERPMPGPFVHRIDPVLADLGVVYLWWYGSCYAVGLLVLHLWLRLARRRLGLSVADVYDLSLLVALGVLVGARAVEVVVYEWPYYGRHPWHIPACWLGGMSSHGILLGGATGAWLFCRLRRQPFLVVADELAIPAALLMGLGRIANFIDGQIVGPVSDAWWAVKFPDAEGYRHPVVLYEGAKNLLLVPLLLFVRRPHAPGVVLAHFVLWYGLLRVFVDLYREYPTTLFGIATGQGLNLLMAALGAGLLLWFSRAPVRRLETPVPAPATAARLWPRRLAFTVVLASYLLIPSDWTQDVPERYGKRHPGLRHSLLYPPIEQ
jgi:phosphatidylglycerol:prolipoprotein diacylglycerol transferase